MHVLSGFPEKVPGIILNIISHFLTTVVLHILHTTAHQQFKVARVLTYLGHLTDEFKEHRIRRLFLLPGV